MANLFQGVRMKRPGKNKFDLSHERKFSMNMGDLIPFMVQEVVPGDAFRVNTEAFMRLAPMLAPVMHRVNVWTHYFFVPNRIIWPGFENFITGGRLGTTVTVAPYLKVSDMVTANRLQITSLADYLGLPTVEGPVVLDQNISALPFSAYQMIYNEYYRDQNLVADIPFACVDGDNVANLSDLTVIRKRCWEKDYFTSALPFAQRGPAVEIPFDAQIAYKDEAILFDSATAVDPPGVMSGIPTGGADGRSNISVPGFGPLGIDNIDEITSSGTTINDLRRSIRLQEWLEKNARAGARYIEQIMSHFGVKSSDARLQRPEYLGGGRQAIVMSEVLQTAQSVDGEGNPVGTPLADMSGHGLSIGRSNGFKRRFEEHGYIIGITSVLPKTAYQQGIPKHFQRFDKFDYYWPEFAQIGEQEVKTKELFYNSLAATDPEVLFGYQSRYAEMKYGCSSVHGEFKNNLAFWHMGRIFTAVPTLSPEFVEADPTTRIFSSLDTNNDKLWCQYYNKVDALRPMPYFGTPTL